jgi:hypothetical protein
MSGRVIVADQLGEEPTLAIERFGPSNQISKRMFVDRPDSSNEASGFIHFR